MLRTLFAAALVAAAAPALAQEPVTVPGQAPHAAERAGDYPYQLFVPPGYATDKRQRWPVLIFLHGSGERGDDLAQVTKWGPPHVLAHHPGTPMLVLSPQLQADADWDVAKLDRLLADVRRQYRVDPSRIYLTGLSLGGIATWRWALARPDLFAAVAPVAARRAMDASTPAGGADACRIAALPIWAFHGDDDGAVPPMGNFQMVEAVRACHGPVKPRFTIYPATDHFSWVPAYDDPALWRWFAEQRRATPAP